MVWYQHNSHLQLYISRKLKVELKEIAKKERRSLSKTAVELIESGLAQKNKTAQPVEA